MGTRALSRRDDGEDGEREERLGVEVLVECYKIVERVSRLDERSCGGERSDVLIYSPSAARDKLKLNT